MSKHILVEGVDLSGKSSVSLGFVEKNPAWTRKKDALTSDNPHYFLADSLTGDPKYSAEHLGNLYVAAVLYDIAHYQCPKTDTIQDSTILLRSIAYHTVRGTPRIPEILTELAPKFPVFDKTFILTTDIETRRQRLKMRQAENVSIEDSLVFKDVHTFMKREEVLLDIAKRHFQPVIIDTTRLSISEVICQIEEQAGIYVPNRKKVS